LPRIKPVFQQHEQNRLTAGHWRQAAAACVNVISCEEGVVPGLEGRAGEVVEGGGVFDDVARGGLGGVKVVAGGREAEPESGRHLKHA